MERPFFVGVGPLSRCTSVHTLHGFEWDPAKARSNRQKHGIDFADAVGVFEDPFAVTIDDPDRHEERFLTLGMGALARLVVVAWTLRADNIRIISARPAGARERRQYERDL